jgi:hypothetical protein
MRLLLLLLGGFALAAPTLITIGLTAIAPLLRVLGH